MLGLHNLNTAVGDSIAIIAYHTYGNDSFEIPGCDARYQYYGGGGTPQVWFDGVIQRIGGHHTNPVNYTPQFNTRKVVPSPVTMTAELVSYNPRNGQGLVNTKVTNVSDEEVMGCFHLNVTGDDTAYAWQGQTHLYYTAIQIDFGDNTCFVLAPGESAEGMDQVFTISPGWRGRSCTMVGFFQDPATKVIHQGALIHGLTNSLQEQIANGELQLDWNTIFMASEYWIFGEAENPHFLPDVSLNYVNRVAIVDGQTTAWSTTQGIADPQANWTYIVIAANRQNQVMWQSPPVSEYDFGLEVGTP